MESRKASDRQLFVEIIALVSLKFSSDFFLRNFAHLLFNFTKEKEISVAITFLKNIKQIRNAFGKQTHLNENMIAKLEEICNIFITKIGKVKSKIVLELAKEALAFLEEKEDLMYKYSSTLWLQEENRRIEQENSVMREESLNSDFSSKGKDARMQNKKQQTGLKVINSMNRKNSKLQLQGQLLTPGSA